MTPSLLEVGNKLIQVGNKHKSILTPRAQFPKFYRFFDLTRSLICMECGIGVLRENVALGQENQFVEINEGTFFSYYTCLFYLNFRRDLDR